MQIDAILEENKSDSESIVTSVEKAESNITCAESTESKEASFIDEEHGKLSETYVLDFSGSKGAYIMPYYFHAKEIYEHKKQKDIADHSSGDNEHQSNEAQDAENKEEEAPQIDMILEENENDSESIVTSVIEKAESNITCAEYVESSGARFISKEHGKLSKTVVHDFFWK